MLASLLHGMFAVCSFPIFFSICMIYVTHDFIHSENTECPH